MCLIIFSPKLAPIPLQHIRESWKQNSHGAGIMWIQDGGVCVEKGFMKLKDLLARVSELNGRVPCLAVHLRWATHGAHSKELCHPFPLHETGQLMHNGILSMDLPSKWTGSDTSYFAEQVSKNFDPNWITAEKNNWFIRKVMDELTSGSRMLYLYPTRYHTTGNWHEKDGVMYSNYSYVETETKWGNWRQREWSTEKQQFIDLETKTATTLFPEPKSEKALWEQETDPDFIEFTLNPIDFQCSYDQAVEVAAMCSDLHGVTIKVDLKELSSSVQWFGEMIREALAMLEGMTDAAPTAKV